MTKGIFFVIMVQQKFRVIFLVYKKEVLVIRRGRESEALSFYLGRDGGGTFNYSNFGAHGLLTGDVASASDFEEFIKFADFWGFYWFGEFRINYFMDEIRAVRPFDGGRGWREDEIREIVDDYDYINFFKAIEVTDREIIYDLTKCYDEEGGGGEEEEGDFFKEFEEFTGMSINFLTSVGGEKIKAMTEGACLYFRFFERPKKKK